MSVEQKKEVDYQIRRATPTDIEHIVKHRLAMFHEMEPLPADEQSELAEQCRHYFRDSLVSGEYQGWLVEVAGEVIAGAGVQIRRLLPSPNRRKVDNLNFVEAFVLNVYTEPQWRRRGLAEKLMFVIADWCQGQGIGRIGLHASEMGRPVYEKLGYQPTNEMRLYLNQYQASC